MLFCFSLTSVSLSSRMQKMQGEEGCRKKKVVDLKDAENAVRDENGAP